MNTWTVKLIRCTRARFRVIAMFGVLAGASLGLAGCSSTRVSGDWSADFESYAVAADHPLASAAGAEILAAGGNAVDAAVATSFTLSVVRPFSCGIGGGGFMVISLPATEARPAVRTAINYRETSPAGVHATFYMDSGASSLHGGTAVGVPGTVAGLLHAHERFGVLDLDTVLAPAIRAARDGFVADQAFVSAAKGRIEYFEKHPKDRERFRFVWERFCREGWIKLGDRIENPEQAHALQLIAQQGADAFYRGPIAEAIVRVVQADGGLMSPTDLRRYAVSDSDPLEFEYQGKRVFTMPPPSSGGVALAQIAGIYQRLLERVSPEGITPALRAHLYAEASAHAFADRAEYLADAAYVQVPVGWLISSQRLDSLAESVSLTHPKPADTYGSTLPFKDDSGTSHFSIVDAFGGAVACTETINTTFGSMLAVPEFGFVLNNEMDDFTTISGAVNSYGLRQSDKNLPAPGKRPLSSMTPTIVLDASGRPVLLTGASGGPRIISAVIQTLLEPNPLGGSHNLDQPRLHHQWLPFVLQHEPGVPEELLRELAGMGHELKERPSVGVAQTIRRVQTEDGPRWRAQSDPRKGGRPAGQ